MFGHSPVREIAVIVAIKMAILVAGGLLVFGPNRLAISAHSVEVHVFQIAPESYQ